MGTYHHLRPSRRKVAQFPVVNHLQSFGLEASHLGGIVHNIAKTIKAAAVRQLLLGGADSFHHSETEACVVVDDNLHIFNFQL